MITRRADYVVLPVPGRDRLGEGPWWSAVDQRLMWVDIWGRAVRRAALDGSGYQEWSTPSDVGFAIAAADGHVVLGLADGLHCLDVVTGSLARSDHRLELSPELRINDGKTDRQGRLWFGSIREDGRAPNASLYRCDERGLTVVANGITASNGIGWSPDGDRMYYVDSPTHTIVAYHFDAASGGASTPTVFATDPPGYTPDGLTVDAEGFVWSAKWDGGRVVRYAPNGRPVLSLTFPVRRITSCMFVGAGLDILAVTSAQSNDDDAHGRELAGSVFLVPVDVRGLPEQPVACA
jgi:sugar lactone lactonase YvrE